MKPIDNIPNKKTVITNINLGSSDKTFIPIVPFSPANENHKLAKINIKKDVNFDIPTIIRESMKNNYDVLTNTENESDYSEENDVNEIFNHEKINTYFNHIFISSLSIVGLFMLYRLIQKTK